MSKKKTQPDWSFDPEELAKVCDDERIENVWEETDTRLQGRLLIAFLGTASSGKTSAIRSLFGVDLGDISPIPGSTRTVKYLPISDNVVVADAPGFQDINQQTSQQARDLLGEVDVFVYVMNAEGGVKQAELEDYTDCAAFGRPVLVAMNKIDLLRPADRERFLRDQHIKLGVNPDDFIPVAFDPHPAIAEKPINVEQVEAWLDSALATHGKDLLLAKALQDKARACERLIGHAAAESALVGALPIPGSDYIPLTAIQLKLLREIAEVHEYKLSRQDASLFIGQMMGKAIGRSLFRGVISLLKAAGWLPGGQLGSLAVSAVAAGVAASLTYGIGKAGVAYFASGMTLPFEELESIFEDAYQSRRAAESDS